MIEEDLYHQAVVQLARQAAGAGRLEAPDGAATVDNPLCGDRVTFEVSLRDGRIAALAHRVRGCLLCQASASLIGRAAPGVTPAEVDTAREGLAALLERKGSQAGNGDVAAPGGGWAGLSAFAPVAAVPSRRRCALLPFEALGEALSRARR